MLMKKSTFKHYQTLKNQIIMFYENTLQTAIDIAKAELERAEQSLIIYNYLLTLNEFHKYDAFRLSTDDQHRLQTILTDSELAELKKLI